MASSGPSRAWLLVPAVLGLGMAATFYLLREAQRPRGEHAGEEIVDLSLRAPPGQGEEAARAVQARLGALGIRSLAKELGPEFVRLRLYGVQDAPGAVATALARDPGGLYLAQSAMPSGPGVAGALTRDQAQAQLAALALPEGTAAFVECPQAASREEPPPCRVSLFEAPPVLTPTEVLSAVVSADPRTEEPLVRIDLEPSAAARLRALAQQRPEAQLGFVAFGELVHRAALTQALEAEFLRFSTRTERSTRRSAVQVAERIAAALRAARLPELEVQGLTPVN
jgi:hypothetical protein